MEIIALADLAICVCIAPIVDSQFKGGVGDSNVLLASAVPCGMMVCAFYGRWIDSSTRLNNLSNSLGIPKLYIMTLLCVFLFLVATYSMCHVFHALLMKRKRLAKLLQETGLTRRRFATLPVKQVFVSAYVMSSICNFEFLRNAHGCADWLAEGYYLYIGADWDFSLGRWLIGLVNSSTMNVVMPVLVVFVCATLQAVSALLIIDLLDIDSIPLSVLSAASIVAAPAVVEQYLYIYTALAYGVALTLSVMCAYVVLRGVSL